MRSRQVRSSYLDIGCTSTADKAERERLEGPEPRARMRGETPAADLGLTGLNLARVKRLKLQACYKAGTDTRPPVPLEVLKQLS
jgi:hypothetical protein